MAELYLEDFVVGQRFTSATHMIDADQIKDFASRFDPQPFHTDEAAAKGSFFQGLAASGWHTASITMALLVKSEVLAVTPSRSKLDRGMITLKSETKNQKGEVVQILTSKMLVWKRP